MIADACGRLRGRTLAVELLSIARAKSINGAYALNAELATFGLEAVIDAPCLAAQLGSSTAPPRPYSYAMKKAPSSLPARKHRAPTQYILSVSWTLGAMLIASPYRHPAMTLTYLHHRFAESSHNSPRLHSTKQRAYR